MRIPSLLGAVLGLIALCPAALMASPSAAAGQPDILILVYSGLGPMDQVGLTYPKPTPHTQVQRDLSQMQTTTGWAESKVKISDDYFRHDKMTSAQFVTRGVVAPGSQSLPLSQLILALRSYPHLSVTYFLPEPMDFKGLRDYTDNNVDVHFEQHGSVYTYHVRILNPNFDRLTIPQYQPTATAVASRDQPARRTVRAWQVLLLAVVAAGAGVCVYLATSRRA